MTVAGGPQGTINSTLIEASKHESFFYKKNHYNLKSPDIIVKQTSHMNNTSYIFNR